MKKIIGEQMSHLIKILPVLSLLTITLAVDNNEKESSETAVDRATLTIDRATLLEEAHTENILINDQEIAPIDVEKINKLRLEKAKRQKMIADRILHLHKISKFNQDKGLQAIGDKINKQPQLENKLTAQPDTK